MTMEEIAAALGLEAVERCDREVRDAYASDLLSDVLGNAKPDTALITIQAHKNTVAVAGIKDMAAVILCNGRDVPQDMAEAAREEGIGIYRSRQTQFEVSGRLWDLFAERRA